MILLYHTSRDLSNLFLDVKRLILTLDFSPKLCYNLLVKRKENKMKKIECMYEGTIEVSDDFNCSYCDECVFCPEGSYTYEEEKGE